MIGLLRDALASVIAPGFFDDSAVHVALAVGGVVAIVSGVVGVFTVLRGNSFAGHALADLGATGGSGALLIGISPLIGFLGVAMIAAGVIESIGISRPRGRDVATGIVLGLGMGLAALFLYWDTTDSSTTGASTAILFGSVFFVEPGTVWLVVALGGGALLLLGLVYRMLLLTAVSPDMAAARGIAVRAVGLVYLTALAIAVALSALTIGAILSTALLIGPAATAVRRSRRPGLATLVAALLGLAATWLGVLLAYDSYRWPPVRHGWPVSFFIVALVYLCYLASLTRAPRPRTWGPRCRALIVRALIVRALRRTTHPKAATPASEGES